MAVRRKVTRPLGFSGASAVRLGPRYQSEVMQETSLLGLWMLDEASGTTINDAFTGGHNGTYSGATLNQAALFAQSSASALGGASGQGVGSVTSAAWMDFSGPFSVECWVKFNNITAVKGIVSRYANNGWLMWSDGSAAFGWLINSAGTDKKVAGPPLVSGVVMHGVGTYDGSSTSKWYVNGALVGSLAGITSGGNITDHAVPMQIGGYNGTNFSQHTIAAVSLYNAELSAARIAAHYAAGVVAA